MESELGEVLNKKGMDMVREHPRLHDGRVALHHRPR